jgi:hypothetical protein
MHDRSLPLLSYATWFFLAVQDCTPDHLFFAAFLSQSSALNRNLPPQWEESRLRNGMKTITTLGNGENVSEENYLAVVHPLLGGGDPATFH